MWPLDYYRLLILGVYSNARVELILASNFEPLVNVIKDDDRLTVLVRQKYWPRGIRRVGTYEKPKKKKPSYRWRIAGVFSLSELKKEEARDG
jgi:hypothetical protein